MAKPPKSRGRRYTDDAPLTAAELRTARPIKEAFPEIAVAYRKGNLKRRRGERGPQKTPTKVQLNIRISPDVITFFKAKGHGWQTRIDNALRAFVEVAR